MTAIAQPGANFFMIELTAADARPRPELRALTGLRGLAASAVALAHFQNALPSNAAAQFMWHNAVDLFFVLSGFTLSYVYRRETFLFPNYLTARVARIYPLYIVCLIATGALYVWPFMVNPATYPASRAASDFFLQLAMLNAWPLIGSGVHWDTPAWSLSAEWFCYAALFPLLLFRNAPPSAATRLLGIVVASATCYWLFVHYYDGHLGDVEIYVPESHWSYWVALARATCGFLAGWLAFASYRRRDGLHAACMRFGGSIWCGVALAVLLAYRNVINPQALVFAWPFVVLAATGEASFTSRQLGSKPLHFLGIISYSIYMTHLIVLITFISRFGAPDTWPLPVFALLVGTAIITSIGAHFALEVPARNAIRSLSRNTKASTHAAPLVSPGASE
ncbi:acyltransferase family protein [Bradyrhizobium sp. USDA 4529]